MSSNDPEKDTEKDAPKTWNPTRRNVLQSAAAATAVTGFAEITVAQDDEQTINPDETIVLGGRVEGWQGRDPASIDGEVNPSLTLAAGETYDLTWINVDGLPHNIAFLNGEGSVLRKTEIIDQQGAEQSISFKANENMASYVCQVHPTSMQGNVVTGGGEETPVPEPGKAAVPQGPKVGLQKIAGAPLTQPVSFESVTIDGTEHRFIVDQTGEIYRVTPDGLKEFLDITHRLVIKDDGFDERGLLGLAFHPNFQENRKFYVRYSGHPQKEQLPEGYDHMGILAEYEAGQNFKSADAASERILLEVPEPQFNHNAGDITFGPDGNLYVALGDGGAADDTGLGHVNDWYHPNGGGNGQDVTENLLGSILRIDVNGREDGKPYGIPDDNPLVGTEGLDEQFAWGFRNPWRMSFNDGRLVVADVGQNLFEEVDIVQKGGNYGWNVREGYHCFSTEKPNEPNAIKDCPTNAPDLEPYNGQPLRDPVLEYQHSVDNQTVGLSVTGGYVYQGQQISELQGMYVFGDWSASFGQPAGRLWMADLDQLQQRDNPVDGFPMKELVVAGRENGELGETVLSFGRDSQGDIYVLTSDTTTIDGTGFVYKIVPPGQAGQQAQTTTAQNETATGNETAGNETTPTGNETAGNETTPTGNETTANETGNETNSSSSMLGGVGSTVDKSGVGILGALGGLGSVASYLAVRDDEDDEE